MDSAADVGTALMRWTPKRALIVLTFAVVPVFAGTGYAADRYAVVVSGASGGSEYAQKYREWRIALTVLLHTRFGYPEDHVIVISEDSEPRVLKPTRENVRTALSDIQRRAGKDDVVFIMLIGHGAAEGSDEAKFNLTGPDLSAGDWAKLLAPIAGRVVFVNGASGSFPFLQKLAARGRIVISATASIAQDYETVFPEYFIKGLGDAGADADKDRKVSVWEAFRYASAGVHDWFNERGQLPTERPLLDDTGDGIGREADDDKAVDGAAAKVTYLQPDTADPPAAADSELSALLRRRDVLQADIDALRARKSNLPDDQYQLELERLLVDLAVVDRDIRQRRP
jgi:hypothetical protein